LNFIGGVHNFIGDNFVLLAIFTTLLAKIQIYWRTGNFGRLFPVCNHNKKCKPSSKWCAFFIISAAAVSTHKDEPFTVLVIFERQTLSIVNDIGFDCDLDFINNCYMIIFFRLLQSQTNLRASSAKAAEVDADPCCIALSEDFF
jgi:hypothetical protein